MRNQNQGELDDAKLVDGLTGDRSVDHFYSSHGMTCGDLHCIDWCSRGAEKLTMDPIHLMELER